MTRHLETGLPQVKICGLTRPDEAEACARMGADAIGCVFYPPSPRHVSEARAKSIGRVLAAYACTPVGVFVDASFAEIIKKVDICGLGAVQLHGRERPQLVDALTRRGVKVIKGLFVNAAPAFDAAASYGAFAYLAECAGGPLPGGNARIWRWEAAAELSAKYPLVLAGGLTPDNVGKAIGAARPDAVDVSSGVEASPGRKDLNQVKHFLEAVSGCVAFGKTRRIFE